MDIKLIFRRTMAYSLSAGLLTGIFAMLIITATNLLSTYVKLSSLKISVFAVLFIALLFNPLRNKIQKIIDRVFYKKTYDYYATMKKVSHDLVSMFELKKIFNYVGEMLYSTMNLRSIYILAAAPSGNFEAVYHMAYGKEKAVEKQDMAKSTGKGLLWIDRDCYIMKMLKTPDDVIIKYDLPATVDIHGEEAVTSVINTMKAFQGEAIVPVFVDNALAFLIILGEKRSGDLFSDEDISFLNTIGNQAAIAIKNANLYTEKLNSEKFASMGVMSSTFAHEIRTPLTSIKTFAQLMPEKWEDVEFREVFSKLVVDDVARIDSLIKDLLHFSSGKDLSSMEKVNVTSLMNEVLDHLKSKLELDNKQIRVEKKYDGTKVIVQGDAKKLTQAFSNIANNGCQAIEEQGVLAVNITPNGENVSISISDTGKGISGVEIDKIFDPFFTTKPMGIGLGLAICRKIVTDHNGTIAVTSEIARGTTFTISLPLMN